MTSSCMEMHIINYCVVYNMVSQFTLCGFVVTIIGRGHAPENLLFYGAKSIFIPQTILKLSWENKEIRK